MITPTKKLKLTPSLSSKGDMTTENNSEQLTVRAPTMMMQGLVTMDHVLSTLETDEYIRKAKAHKWKKSKVGRSSSQSNVDDYSVRNSAQFEFEDEKLAQTMFKIGERALNDMFAGPNAKFIPVGIDSNWKCYRYKKGEFFGKHKDSGRSVNDCKSFVTVLIYLNGHEDLEGGETIFYGPGCKEGISIHPTRGKAVFFVHQLDHESVEVTKGTKYILKSVVLFKKNENYGRNNSYSQTPTDPVSGLKLFEFPERNPQIFKTFVLPVLNNEVLPNSVTDQALKDKLDFEFKFWGLLSPFDPLLTISTEQELLSKEYTSISTLLRHDLEEKLCMMEWRLQFLNILEKVKIKKEQFSPLLFEQDSLQEIMKNNKSKFSKGSNITTQKWKFYDWIAQKIEEHLSTKYEVLPLKYHYDSNAFLIGHDRHLYEMCEKTFGEQAVSIQQIQFIHESHSMMDSRCDTSSYPMQSVTDEMVERCEKNGYYHTFRSYLTDQLNEEKITTVSEILKRFEGVCITMKYKDLILHGRQEKSWQGEYNDEYYPSYSLFVLCALVIDYSKLK
ncbi:hypothetical protein C9374_008804 [Naegleria lovaniensis]|uniref:Fe2OG dioxygenase domain-containing protein n=1 Tax=Naegleria lovaniensis TaxID=51637 RepID=A0AA88GHR9_NAELO|nr:uncharacterized protein C9374_008804 [Naegleria lovaniensis]KAG2377719.1 hypothetical protein C9374_008804 [Naegleria lovaniensis]